MPSLRILSAAIAAVVAVAFLTAGGFSAEPTAPAKPAGLAFAPRDGGFAFDTGALAGMLFPKRRAVKTPGLLPIVDTASGAPVARGEAYGLMVFYRLLDSEARYGKGGWDWESKAELLPDGAVEVRWTADAEHAFDMKAVYRWANPQAIDVRTTVTARKEQKRFEVYLASYFAYKEFPTACVYVQGAPETGGTPGLLEAKASVSFVHAFPRDAEAVKILQDGRWRRPPHPITWTIRPTLQAPLALRRHGKTDLTGIVMAPKEDCFAVSALAGDGGHDSLYLSLFGRDLKGGEPATARARLVVGHGITDQQAIALYEAYLNDLKADR